MTRNKTKPIKVLIIDDSAFNRQTIKGILEKVPYIEVKGLAFDGHDGMKKILELKPDVVTLDLEMPKMDGFTLLRWIMKERPMPVIVVSAFGDDPTVFKALELGAVDFVIKPTKKASSELKEIESDLLRKVLGIASLSMEKIKKNLKLLEQSRQVGKTGFFSNKKVEIIAIGASTGGPTAIQSILTRLPDKFPCAIVVSQHMPRGFTRQFAERMNKLSLLEIKETEQGDLIEPGKVIICPGGHHMVFEQTRKGIIALIKKSSPEDRYVPSIDLMMKSIAEKFGSKTMGILLTGMGNDGKEGMLDIKDRGGFTIAESEESSIVFGMPREIILAGGADTILPLEKIPAEIMKKMKKGPVR